MIIDKLIIKGKIYMQLMIYSTVLPLQVTLVYLMKQVWVKVTQIQKYR